MSHRRSIQSDLPIHLDHPRILRQQCRNQIPSRYRNQIPSRYRNQIPSRYRNQIPSRYQFQIRLSSLQLHHLGHPMSHRRSIQSDLPIHLDHPMILRQQFRKQIPSR
ncbi:hypothetical protein DPMN_152015 [Dreissena polymorpha]|uniref:Uncharacterized protein n=1 Tax=Dreissena polymorpha TaxID=45954 RepID=A0A9D4FKK4_DREPO|nr:hypothetical protein DPMN_152015 [Dreissena polymorpha]